MHRDENFHRTLTIPHAASDDARPALAHLGTGWTWTERRGQAALPLAETMRGLAERASHEDRERRQQAWIDAALSHDQADLLLLRDAWGAPLAAFLLALDGETLRVSEVALTGDALTRRRIAAVILRRISEHVHADDVRSLAVDSACVEDQLHALGWKTDGYAGDSHHVWVPAPQD